MSQLLIIDVQNSYRRSIDKHLYNNIKEFSSKFSEIIYLWDSGSGQDLSDEIPDEWGLFSEDAPEDNSDYIPFSDSFYFMTKQYGFFRDLMGKGFSDEDIIKLGKFMLKNKINDAREIHEDNQILKKFKKEFKNSDIETIDFNSYNFNIPDVLLELQGKIQNNVILVGGGVNECLKEVSLILDILDIQHSINYSLTY